jgi:hypothetical protein
MCAVLGGGLKEGVAGGALCTERAGLGLITGGDVPDASASVARMPSDRRKEPPRPQPLVTAPTARQQAIADGDVRLQVERLPRCFAQHSLQGAVAHAATTDRQQLQQARGEWVKVTGHGSSD